MSQPRPYSLLLSLAGMTLVGFLAVALVGSPSHSAHAGAAVVPTDTPRPPSPTSTPVPPTNTPVPPTNTPAPPTNTPAPPAPDVRAPDVVVALEGNGLCSPQDGLVRYTVHISNAGDSSAYNVHVTSIVGDGTAVESIDLKQGLLRKGEASNESILDVGTVAPNQDVVAVVTLRLTGAPGSSVRVLAHAETSTPGDPTFNNIQTLGCAIGAGTPEPAATAPIILPVTGGDL